MSYQSVESEKRPDGIWNFETRSGAQDMIVALGLDDCNCVRAILADKKTAWIVERDKGGDTTQYLCNDGRWRKQNDRQSRESSEKLYIYPRWPGSHDSIKRLEVD